MFITFHMDNTDHPIRKDNGNGVELFFFLSSWLFSLKKKLKKVLRLQLHIYLYNVNKEPNTDIPKKE